MQNVKIKKAKIKEKLFLEVEYTEHLQGHSKKDTKLTCTIPVHEDLKTAFEKLHRHLAILSDYVEAPGKEDFETVVYSEFGVRSFSIGGSDENEGVTISGYKDGQYGLVNINTPFTRYDDDEYTFISELGEDVEACIYEVEEYLFNGKRAPEAQMKIEFADEDLVEENLVEQ